ncbi:MAG: HD domain-containing protein [Candidatus Nomurabacteria bacterium]|jgi:putative hydrolase of HD superfamily|nr:HD domain-containing protein [Candidatus Nomurabacteria bacterium]
MSKPEPKTTRDIEEIFEFLTLAEKLKTIKRDNLKSNGEFETDADHSWMLALMAILFEPKLKHKVDMARVMKLAVVHDLAEAETGDVSLHEQFSADGVKEAKDQAELEAMTKTCKLLPKKLGDEIYDLWREYEDRKTPEAKYVKALDKLEATFQSLMFEDIRYWERYGDGKIYYDIVLKDKKKLYYEHEESLVVFGEKLKEVTREKMLAAGLDLTEYDEDKNESSRIGAN